MDVQSMSKHDLRAECEQVARQQADRPTNANAPPARPSSMRSLEAHPERGRGVAAGVVA
jgi:hypothetical protein